LLDVRYAPIATKFCIAAKRRDVPIGDIGRLAEMKEAAN
jgi:hypothetical protein